MRAIAELRHFTLAPNLCLWDSSEPTPYLSYFFSPVHVVTPA